MTILRKAVAWVVVAFGALVSIIGAFDHTAEVSTRVIGIGIVAWLTYAIYRWLTRARPPKTTMVHRAPAFQTAASKPILNVSGHQKASPPRKASGAAAKKAPARPRDGTKVIGDICKTDRWGTRTFTPYTLDDWDRFAEPYLARAAEIRKEALALQRLSETKATDAHHERAKQLHDDAQSWVKRFEAEYDRYMPSTDSADSKADKLYDKVFEAEGEAYDALWHLDSVIEGRNDLDAQ